MTSPQPVPGSEQPDLPEGADPHIWAAVHQLIIDEQNGARVPLALGPYSAYMVLASLQLAWRNPAVQSQPNLADLIRGVGAQLETIFADGPLAALTAEGWNPAKDVEQNPQQN